MEEGDADLMMIRMVGGWMFLLVLARPGRPVQIFVKRLFFFGYTEALHTVYQ